MHLLYCTPGVEPFVSISYCEIDLCMWKYFHCLLEATQLTDTDEKFVLTGVDYVKAKTNKDLFEQIKASLKKFQGRKVIGSEDNMVFDPALVANVAQALLAQGWAKPKGRRRSTSDPGEFGNLTSDPGEFDNSSVKPQKVKTIHVEEMDVFLLVSNVVVINI